MEPIALTRQQADTCEVSGNVLVLANQAKAICELIKDLEEQEDGFGTDPFMSDEAIKFDRECYREGRKGCRNERKRARQELEDNLDDDERLEYDLAMCVAQVEYFKKLACKAFKPNIYEEHCSDVEKKAKEIITKFA
jgi:hypothetical protein